MCLVTLTMSAQRKVISQAKEYIKKGNNLEKAEQLMRDLLKDSTNRDNEKIWLTLFDAEKKQYAQGNEKLYLKQQYDTTALFNNTMKMFNTLESFDSVCVSLSKKDKGKNPYRKKHSQFLHSIRRNLYNGGTFFINHKQYDKAYSFFDTFIDCARQPLFSAYNYNETDTLMSVAAYWAVYCGYKMKNPKATLHHSYLALKDKQHYHLMLQYLAETYKMEDDTARYAQTLRDGFNSYPTFPYFFPHLVEYYSERLDWKSALSVCNQALQADSKSKIFRFAKSTVLFNTAKYKECISICDSLIKEDPNFAEAYLNVGLSYYNQAVDINKKSKLSSKDRQNMRQLFEQALPYLEKYRKMAPDQTSLWGVPLYTIYLNLNKGEQFEEIDKLLKETKKSK